MKNFFIIARSLEAPYDEYVDRVTAYLCEKGASVTVCDGQAAYATINDGKSLQIPKGCECVLTVGGDGIVVRAAALTACVDIPLCGINYGHLGYLCEITPEGLEVGLDKLLADDYSLERRMMLSGYENGEPYADALNDVVITSAERGLSVINLEVSVNGSYLYRYDCDGLLFATPTGSTAYNLSLGGPIVAPDAKCIVMTPIGPHTLNSRPIVLGPNDEVTVTLKSRNLLGDEQVVVCFDGEEKKTLSVGGKITISASPNTTSMVRLEDSSFLERLRVRMAE